VFEKVTEIKT